MSTSRQRESFPGRTFYRAGNGVVWSRFLPWILLPFAVAAALAEGMYQLFSFGQYYVLIVPLFACAAVAGLLRLAVNKGHCRSALIAGTAGLLAGCVLYGGYYYAGMIHDLTPIAGPEIARRPDLLPKYIRLRMETQKLHDTRHRDDDEHQAPGTVDVVFNWIVFGGELAMVLAFTTWAAINRSRKTYCPSCQRWMIREITQFDPVQAAELTEALRTGSARSLAALAAKPVFATVPNLTLGVEFCPSVKDGVSRDCAAYVSLKNVAQSSANSFQDMFEASKGKVALRALQLSPDEIAALGSRFTVFETLSGRAAVAALKPPEPEKESDEAPAGPFVDIQPVESDYAGKVLTRRNAWISTASTFASLLLLFVGLGLAAWGGITAFPDKDSPRQVSPEKKTFGIVVMTLGLIFFGGTAIFFLVNPTYFGNRYIVKQVRREFARRPKCLVDPDDPEALFVEIVPKLNWGKMLLESASDVGFLRLDRSRREILFEGDRQRFRLPAGAITDCAVEIHVEGEGTDAARRVYFVVVRARHTREFWEAPIRERGGRGMMRSGRRKRAAERLCVGIQELRARS